MLERAVTLEPSAHACWVAGDEADGRQGPFVGDGLGLLAHVALNGVGQSIKTGRSGHALGHGHGQGRIVDSYIGDEIGAADEHFDVGVQVGDDGVAGHFAPRTGSRRDRDHGQGGILDLVLTHVVGDGTRVGGHQADGFRGIDGAASADGDKKSHPSPPTSSGPPARCWALGYFVVDGGIDVILPGFPSLYQDSLIGDHLVGHDQGLLAHAVTTSASLSGLPVPVIILAGKRISLIIISIPSCFFVNGGFTVTLFNFSCLGRPWPRRLCRRR